MFGYVTPEFWQGKKVFLTGHTGFKGAWLALWLSEMGAKVTGYALAPDTKPSLFDLLKLEETITSIIGDVRNPQDLRLAMIDCQPDVVLHLAAQPIVSTGYEDPVGTFETNIMGVVHLLEVCREFGGKLPVLIVSSDKCYKNNDGGRAFTITDPLGGKDPYSASKAGTEIVVGAYTASYFQDVDGPVVASARAGNVVGGGDWSLNRLLPDGARAFSENLPLVLRNPRATRPWQHVIEPLYGYLALVEAMSVSREFGRAWNFGPHNRNHQAVGVLAELFAKSWGSEARVEVTTSSQDWKEAETLDLDCSETNETLNWMPALSLDDTVSWTAGWYKKAHADLTTDNVRKLTLTQIEDYVQLQANRS